MRMKHIMNLKDPENLDTWIALMKYYISPKLYNLHNDFKYLKQNSIIKTEHPQIQFYHEDVISYLHNNKEIIKLKQNVKQIYKHILKNEYKSHNIIGQSIWEKFKKNIPWQKIWQNTFISYFIPENNKILYKLLHFATKTNEYVYRWTNQ